MRELVTKLAEPGRWSYFGRSLARVWDQERRLCPNCGCPRTEIVKRKYLVTALARCMGCRILFRTPTDAPELNGAFYQSAYESGFTTDRPSEEDLERYRQTRFQGTPKDFSLWISVLRALGVDPGARVLDYGASWGYGTWQLAEAGYETVGYEVSRPRARYAREKMNVAVHDDLSAVQGRFDAVFSCHVLEHVPQPSAVIAWARGVLRPGGVFVAVTPNGSRGWMEASPRQYHRCWGQVHPFYLNDDFYGTTLGGSPKLLTSPPYDLAAIGAWDRETDVSLGVSGWELLLATVVGAMNRQATASEVRRGPSDD